MLCKQPAIATSVVGLGLRHSSQAACDLGRFDEEIKPAAITGDHRVSVPGMERWSATADLTEPVTVDMGEQVSVHLATETGERFGVAIIVGLTADSFGYHYNLDGYGALGERPA